MPQCKNIDLRPYINKNSFGYSFFINFACFVVKPMFLQSLSSYENRNKCD